MGGDARHRGARWAAGGGAFRPALTLLAAALPVLVVPMAVEAAARRRGRAPRTVPAWCWLPPALLAVACTLAGVGVGPLLGLALAGAFTLLWRPGHPAHHPQQDEQGPARGRRDP
ncbi:hypothetical protein [Micromonospora sp. NPDC005413]|uniref:hypothetical protein n=1 Tax=Micromonospora sp. NPDC005413 TaxID=3154563 RepID=UPI0033BBA89D